VINLTEIDEKLKKAAEEINEGIDKDERALVAQNLGGRELMETSVGLEGIDPTMFPPPRVKLVQYSTKGATTPSGREIPAGKLWNTATGKMYAELECALLKAGVTRARFEEGNFEAGPLCASRDGVTGPEGQLCEACEFSQWGKESPECKMSFEFLGMTDEGEVFVIRFSGTSFKHARKFINNVRYSHKPLFAHKVKLVTERKESKEGKWFELQILSEGLRTEKECQKLYKDYLEFGRNFAASVVEPGETVIEG